MILRPSSHFSNTTLYIVSLDLSVLFGAAHLCLIDCHCFSFPKPTLLQARSKGRLQDPVPVRGGKDLRKPKCMGNVGLWFESPRHHPSLSQPNLSRPTVCWSAKSEIASPEPEGPADRLRGWQPTKGSG